MEHIVYAFDNNYIEQTLVSLVSLLKHNDYQMKIWIVSDNISKTNKKLMTEQVSGGKAELIFLDIDMILSGISVSNQSRHPKTIYAKLFLEQIIDAEKLLYLDSDTVVAGDLRELWKRNMQHELAAGVQMPYSHKLKMHMDIKPENPYICDGIVLLNLKKWRECKIGSRCRAYIEKHLGSPPMLSEGTLNYVCQNHLGILGPEFNLMPHMLFYKDDQISKLFGAKQYYSKEALDQAKRHPIIVHYVKELYNRPWYEPCDHPLKKMYRTERELLLGDKRYENLDISRHTKITKYLYSRLPFGVYAALYQLRQTLKR